MAKEKQKTMIVLVIVLSILLLAALSYVVYDLYSKARETKNLEIYKQGVTYGYGVAVGELYNLVQSCQPVPVTYLNQTREVIDIACLKSQ